VSFVLATVIRPGFRTLLVIAVANLWAAVAHAQNELTEIPDPDPVAEQAAMKVDSLASVNLFAADPDIRKPIQMNFDSSGGLWIASSEAYPQIRPGEQANDKIIVLRDTDGDGISDKRTVFADGLLIPTGVIPDGPHAAYVAESTRLLYLEDTDRDGKADRRQIVLSGFGTEDTHHLIHTLRMGPDGCLYFNQSIYIHSHVDTAYGTRHLDGGGIWRYHPTSGSLEVFCKGFVNPWGHVFDHVGESLATDGAYFEGINYVFPDSVFVTSPGATRWLKGMNPGSPKHCGIEILSGTHIPPEWSGDIVANDFRSHRVCRFTLKPSGSGYLSRQQPEIITTSHVAFRPIDARMGPDGALYVADWYNPIIQHGEVDFRDDRRDRKHGRIWRVSFPNRDLDVWPDFSKSSTAELIALLEDPSLAVRQFARQELWLHASGAPEQVLSAYRRWASDDKPTRILELLWFNEFLQQTSAEDIRVAFASIDSTDSDARRTMLRSIWRNRTNFAPDSAQRKQIEQIVLGYVSDDDPRVRLEAVVCAGQLDAAKHPDAIRAVLESTKQIVDHNLDFAIWQSIRKLDQSFSDGSILAALPWSDRPAALAYAVSAIGTPQAAEIAVAMLESGGTDVDSTDALVRSVSIAGSAAQLGRIVKALLAADAGNLSRARFKPLLDRTFRDGTIPQNAGAILAEITSRTPGLLEDEDRIDTLARAAGVWKAEELEDVLSHALPSTTGSLRQRVIAALGAFNSDTAHKTVADLATDTDVTTRVAATRSIAASRPRLAIELTIRLLKDDATSDAGTDIIVGLLGRKEMPELLAAAVVDQKLSTDRARSLLRRVQSAGGSPVFERAIRSAGNLENATWKLSAELMQEILTLVKTEGRAARGESVYRREELQCIKCHAIGSAGGLVGPNLISTGGSSQPDYILESLIDSSAKLKEGYTTLSLVTDEGEVFNGIVIGRTDETIRLRLADGKEVQVATEAIELEKPGRSLMPDGLLDSLTKAELVDLVTFLAALGRDPEFTVSTEPLVRSFQTLISTPEANRRLNRTSTDTAASDDPAMQWRPLTTRVDGTIAPSELDQFQQHRETPPTSFLRFTISMQDNGEARIELPTAGIEAWVDAKPTPIWDLAALALSSGKHTIVLAIDRTVQTEPFTLRLSGDATEAN
jgi:putative heme-binding domain-containing protein